MSAAARRTVETSALAAQLRLLALGCKSRGQDERAEGMVLAANMVDSEDFRMSGKALVEILDVMLRACLDEYVADVVAAVKDALAAQGAPPVRVPSVASAAPQDASLKASPRRKRPLAPFPACPGCGSRTHVDCRPRAKGGGVELGAGARRVLIAVAQHREGVSRTQLTVLTGYKKSTRDLYLQKLRQAGYLAAHEDGDLSCTDAGRAWLGGDYEPLPTGSALRDYWLTELGQGEKSVLAYVCKFYPHTVSAEQISRQTGYSKSTRDLYIQRLIARRLLAKTGPGWVCASALLFDEGEAGA